MYAIWAKRDASWNGDDNVCTKSMFMRMVISSATKCVSKFLGYQNRLKEYTHRHNPQTLPYHKECMSPDEQNCATRRIESDKTTSIYNVSTRVLSKK